jgi:hypothetical protein
MPTPMQTKPLAPSEGRPEEIPRSNRPVFRMIVLLCRCGLETRDNCAPRCVGTQKGNHSTSSVVHVFVQLLFLCP